MHVLNWRCRMYERQLKSEPSCIGFHALFLPLIRGILFRIKKIERLLPIGRPGEFGLVMFVLSQTLTLQFRH